MSVLRVGWSRDMKLAAGVVAALLIALIPGQALATAPSLRILRVAGPKGISGNNHFAPIGTLPLPSGHWLVLAKVQIDFVEPNFGNVPTTCQLSTTGMQGNTDTSFVKPPNSAAQGTGPTGIGEVMVFSVADTLNSAGSARVQCATTSGDLVSYFRLLRIVALPVAKLTVANMNGGASSTVGSASPQAVWGWSVTNTTIAANDNADIATYPIPKGRWWLWSGAVAASGSGAVNGDCISHDAHAAGKALFGLSAPPSAGDVQSISTQYWTSAGTNSTGRITCATHGADAAI